MYEVIFLLNTEATLLVNTGITEFPVIKLSLSFEFNRLLTELISIMLIDSILSRLAILIDT